MGFKVGDEVEWTSSSAGVTKTKRGRVERVIPPSGEPGVRNPGLPRDHESYVVRAGGRLYWPRVAALQGVES